jgi:GxxExxY protein
VSAFNREPSAFIGVNRRLTFFRYVGAAWTPRKKESQPPMNADRRRLDEISERVIGRAFTVANTLGAGFLEKVYENALAHELTKAGLMVRQQIAIGVEYDGVTVGTYVADLLVENAVLVEIKAVRALDTNHDAQCLNYLRATGLTVCLWMNFANPRLEIRRRVNGF